MLFSVVLTGVMVAQAYCAATTTFPSASGSTLMAAPISVSGSFDCGMKRYDRTGGICQFGEGGVSDAVFVLTFGATLSNCIIGPNQMEGIFCSGNCTISNVWWEDVCEVALTVKQPSGTTYINGGGAQKGTDTIIQHNGGGAVAISDFYAYSFGKLYRSCSNCRTQYKRTVTIDNSVVKSGSVVCGVNSNYGDTCTLTNTCYSSVTTICQKYTGNNKGDEAPKNGSGNDGVYCIYGSDVQAC